MTREQTKLFLWGPPCGVLPPSDLAWINDCSYTNIHENQSHPKHARDATMLRRRKKIFGKEKNTFLGNLVSPAQTWLCISTPTVCVDRISIHLLCKHMVFNTISLTRNTKLGFCLHYVRPSNFQCVGFVIVSHLDSCSWPMGEFLAPRVDTAFPLLTLWEQGAGPVRWFSSETIMCWFTVRGRAVHSHCFLLTGKWLSGLPNGGRV